MCFTFITKICQTGQILKCTLPRGLHPGKLSPSQQHPRLPSFKLADLLVSSLALKKPHHHKTKISPSLSSVSIFSDDHHLTGNSYSGRLSLPELPELWHSRRDIVVSFGKLYNQLFVLHYLSRKWQSKYDYNNEKATDKDTSFIIKVGIFVDPLIFGQIHLGSRVNNMSMVINFVVVILSFLIHF